VDLRQSGICEKREMRTEREATNAGVPKTCMNLIWGRYMGPVLTAYEYA
jgi:hypothetical protein